MDNENIEAIGPTARSRAAAGYATPFGYDESQGLIIDAEGRAVWDAYEILNAQEFEVRRLRALLKRGRDMINTPTCAPLEEWPSEPEIDAFVAECDAVLGKSHNEVAELRHSGKDSDV